jgi:hypothetical protein
MRRGRRNSRYSLAANNVCGERVMKSGHRDVAMALNNPARL